MSQVNVPYLLFNFLMKKCVKDVNSNKALGFQGIMGKKKGLTYFEGSYEEKQRSNMTLHLVHLYVSMGGKAEKT